MERVSVQDAHVGMGEDAYILQLRPLAPPEADEATLNAQIDQFVSLYLEASGLSLARFAQLGPLTWSIAAPDTFKTQIATLRVDIAETLFGTDDGERVVLSCERIEPRRAEVEALPGTDEDEDEESWEPVHSSAATRAAMDDSSDVFDLDVPDLDIFDIGDVEGSEQDVFDVGSWLPANASEEDDSDLDGEDGSAFETADPPSPDRDHEAGFGDHETPMGDEESLLGEQDFGIDLESLTEPPAVKPTDIAQELAEFRKEIRALAANIPGANPVEALSDFRTELDSVTGALGQRVDGAAQRIEAAADRVCEAASLAPDAERMSGAVERAEASARLMESAVKEAVEALHSVLGSMRTTGEAEENTTKTGL